MTDKALEAALLPCPGCNGLNLTINAYGIEGPTETPQDRAHEVVCDGCGWSGPERAPRTEAIAAWNRRAPISALPGEAEVVERLYRWRSETVNQWSDEYEPRTSWERQVSDAMKEWYEASTQAANALQAMQARAEKAERERDAVNYELSARDGEAWEALVTRAEAAEARVKELEEALERIVSTAKRVDLRKNGALWDLVTPHEIDAARTALKGGSNG